MYFIYRFVVFHVLIVVLDPFFKALEQLIQSRFKIVKVCHLVTKELLKLPPTMFMCGLIFDWVFDFSTYMVTKILLFKSKFLFFIFKFKM